MLNTITVTIADGVRIVVPDSLDLITPYVLIEQQDWFEDEIRFLRKILRPGQRAIDVGANYGVYTLPMAKAVGAAGSVWAFEPASSTAALRRRSSIHSSMRGASRRLTRRSWSAIWQTCRLSIFMSICHDKVPPPNAQVTG